MKKVGTVSECFPWFPVPTFIRDCPRSISILLRILHLSYGVLLMGFNINLEQPNATANRVYDFNVPGRFSQRYRYRSFKCRAITTESRHAGYTGDTFRRELRS